MTNEQILGKIFRKVYSEANEISVIGSDIGYRIDIYIRDKSWPSISMPYECLLFDIENAKILFGEKYMCGEPYRDESTLKEWEFNLQQLAILSTEKRVQYLKEIV